MAVVDFSHRVVGRSWNCKPRSAYCALGFADSTGTGLVWEWDYLYLPTLEKHLGYPLPDEVVNAGIGKEYVTFPDEVVYRAREDSYPGK